MISNNAMIAVFSILTLSMASCMVHAEEKQRLIDEPILPIPLQVKLDPDKVKLGERLFNDTRLNKNNTLSCATCHQLESGGDDNLVSSITSEAKTQTINTPTIFNSRYNFRQNWDGSAEDFADHIDKLITGKKEADTSWDLIIEKINADTDLSRSFTSLYISGITKENYLDALVEFERSLITPNSRFDQYLRGDDDAINGDEKKGYALFKDYGCISCHQGINVGGNLFQKFGIFYNYFDKRGDVTRVDNGRNNITGRDIDYHVFKVPSLRNIALTSPYFHDGKTPSLKSAILLMGKTQLGVSISGHDAHMIELFLNTLTGEYKGELLTDGES